MDCVDSGCHIYHPRARIQRVFVQLFLLTWPYYFLSAGNLETLQIHPFCALQSRFKCDCGQITIQMLSDIIMRVVTIRSTETYAYDQILPIPHPPWLGYAVLKKLAHPLFYSTCCISRPVSRHQTPPLCTCKIRPFRVQALLTAQIIYLNYNPR
jgi:hypothetical protein